MKNPQEQQRSSNPMEVGVGSYDAFQQDVYEHPQTYELLWRKLSRLNPEIALSLLDSSKHTLESGIPADQAHTQGALDLLGALIKNEDAKSLDALQVAPEDVHDQNADVIVNLSWRRRLKARKQKRHAHTENRDAGIGITTTIGAFAVPFALIKRQAEKDDTP